MTCDDCGPMAADLKRATDAWRFWEAQYRHERQTAHDLRRQVGSCLQQFHRAADNLERVVHFVRRARQQPRDGRQTVQRQHVVGGQSMGGRGRHLG